MHPIRHSRRKREIDEEGMTGEVGSLEVELERAQQLRVSRGMTFSYPRGYALLRYKSTQLKGEVRKLSKHDFAWKETFNFALEGVAQGDCIWIDVYTESNQLVGGCKILLEKAIGEAYAPVQRSYSLSNTGPSTGTLIVRLTYTRSISEVEQVPAPPYPPPHHHIPTACPDPSTWSSALVNTWNHPQYAPGTNWNHVPIEDIFPPQPSAPPMRHDHHNSEPSIPAINMYPTSLASASTAPPILQQPDTDFDKFSQAFIGHGC